MTEIRVDGVRRMRNSKQYKQGIIDLANDLPQDSEGVEVGSFVGESSVLFMNTGRIKRLTCIDTWTDGEWAEAEKVFDRDVAVYGDRIRKVKTTSVSGSLMIERASMDFVYIDACHRYEQVKQDVIAWLPVIKPGGIICGHDYNDRHPGVMQVVKELFGRPDKVYQDSSWMVRLSRERFTIVTYCSGNFVDALEEMLPSWISHSGASRIVVYTDHPSVEERIGKRPLVEFRHKFSPCASVQESFMRKIGSLTDHFQHMTHGNFCWLDSDVRARSGIADVFEQIAPSNIGVTRLLGRDSRGRGQCNAGVIFFRYHPVLSEFFQLWTENALALKGKPRMELLFEQQAMSELAMDAFDGLHPFKVAAVSENLFNCERDKEQDWYEAIRRFRPRLMHYKMQRFRKPDVKLAMSEILNELDNPAPVSE